MRVKRTIPLPDSPGDVQTASTLVEQASNYRKQPLGSKQRIWRGVDPHLVSLLDPTAFEADLYRVVRHTVDQKKRAAESFVITVSSAAPGDGKTTTSINIAGALAEDTRVRVLLVDTDLRAPSVAKSLGLKTPLGLVDAVLADQYCFDDVVKQSPLENLFVLPAGAPHVIPYEILKSDGMEALIQEARRRYDYVILDAPPLIPFPDCQLLSQWSDGFLVVVAAHQTSRKMLEEAIDVIGASQVLGFVFNGDVSSYSRYYYSRYYHYAARSSSIKSRGRLAQWAAKLGLLS